MILLVNRTSLLIVKISIKVSPIMSFGYNPGQGKKIKEKETKAKFEIEDKND